MGYFNSFSYPSGIGKWSTGLPTYLQHFGRLDSAANLCWNGDDEMAEHLVFQCPAHDQARRDTLPYQTK